MQTLTECRYYTTSDIARAFQVSKRYVEMGCKSLGVRRHGRAYLIDMLDVQRLAQELYRFSYDPSVFDESRESEAVCEQ